MAVFGIDHVQLAMPAGGEAAARSFYSAIVGIPEVAKPPHLARRGGCWFESSHVKIHLGVEPDFHPARKAHPALLVNDLADLLDRCRHAGFSVAHDEPLEGYERAYVYDPFGNRLEFLEPKPNVAFPTSPLVGVGVIVRKGAEVLLLRRCGTHGAGTWSTPGGHLDFGESPEDCAIREALEETGVKVGSVQFRGLTNDVFADEGKHYVTLWMEAEYLSGEPAVHADYEASEVAWFRLDKLPEPLFLPLQQLLAGRCYPQP